MDADVAVALAFGILGMIFSAISLLQTQHAKTADHKDRRIDRAASRLEAFESISGSEDMVRIQKYKDEHKNDPDGYYWHFRQERPPEIEVARSRLAKFWKLTIQMYKEKALPDDFFNRKGEWLRWGDRYRQLVEPLDVARYYLDGFFEDNQKEYNMATNRPKQHRFLQEKWKLSMRPNERVIDGMDWCVEIEKKLRPPAP